MEVTEIIKIWKELGVDEVRFEFSCGGDSMNDTSIIIEDDKGVSIESQELSDYFEDVVYQRVEFYVNSDGHYQGESGSVIIRLDDEGEDFDFNKCSTSEWSERHQSKTQVELTDEQATFIQSKVLNLNGDCDNLVINYKQDCILTDDEERIADDLERELLDVLREYSPEDCEGELSEWFEFTTNEEGEQIKFVGNEIVVQMSNEHTIYRDDE
jgi:hypothetical protein